jgi:hypothetical protein
MAVNIPFFLISLKIFHPVMDPQEITREIGLNPTHSWLAGEFAKTPKGRALKHVRNESYWCYRLNIANKSFATEIDSLLSYLSSYRNFLNRISLDRGRIELSLDIWGGANMGDIIDHSILARMSALNISMGIEVFPNINRSS